MHEATPFPEVTDLDKFLRKLKLFVKHLNSEDQKLTDLIVTVMDTKSEHSSPPKANTTSIKLPKLSIPKFDGDVLNWRTFWEQFQVSIHNRDHLSDAEMLAYLKDALKDGPAERIV